MDTTNFQFGGITSTTVKQMQLSKAYNNGENLLKTTTFQDNPAQKYAFNSNKSNRKFSNMKKPKSITSSFQSK